MDSGIPQWVHASLVRQYADVLREPIPPELLALLSPEEHAPADATTTGPCAADAQHDDTQRARDGVPMPAMD